MILPLIIIAGLFFESILRQLNTSLQMPSQVVCRVVIVLCLTGFGMNTAYAQATVYEDNNTIGHGGASAAHLNRPENIDNNDEKSQKLARRLMNDIGCMCGGCNKEPVLSCKCGFAAQERGKIIGLLKGKDLTTPKQQELAYNEVRDVFVAAYGGQHVLTSPIDEGFNRLAWMIPLIGLGLALIFLFIIGRRWIAKTDQLVGQDATMDMDVISEDYENKLDDELARHD